MHLHGEFIERKSHPLPITVSLDHLRPQPVQPGRQQTGGHCSVLLVGNMEAQGASQREVCKEGSGHVLNLWVGTLGLEILHVVPEVRGGERPVGHGWWLGVGVWKIQVTTSGPVPLPLPEHPLYSQGKWVVFPRACHCDDTFPGRNGVCILIIPFAH